MESMLRLLIDWIVYYTTLYILELNCRSEGDHDDPMADKENVATVSNAFMRYLCKIIWTLNMHSKYRTVSVHKPNQNYARNSYNNNKYYL